MFTFGRDRHTGDCDVLCQKEVVRDHRAGRDALDTDRCFSFAQSARAELGGRRGRRDGACGIGLVWSLSYGRRLAGVGLESLYAGTVRISQRALGAALQGSRR